MVNKSSKCFHITFSSHITAQASCKTIPLPSSTFQLPYMLSWSLKSCKHVTNTHNPDILGTRAETTELIKEIRVYPIPEFQSDSKLRLRQLLKLLQKICDGTNFYRKKTFRLLTTHASVTFTFCYSIFRDNFSKVFKVHTSCLPTDSRTIFHDGIGAMGGGTGARAPLEEFGGE